MSAPGTDLFQLIQSLTPHEKRYFKLFAQREGPKKNKTYLRLFDLIDQLADDYDEEWVKKKLKDPADIKMLPQLKIYLLDLIVQSMRVYNTEKNVANEVFDLIQDELFFTDKGLTDLRVKALKRAKELAYKYDLTYLIVAILNRERALNHRLLVVDPQERINAIHTEEVSVIQRLNDEAELGRIFFTLQSQYIVDPLLNDQKVLQHFNELRLHPLLRPDMPLHTFLQKFYYYRAHYVICVFNNELEGQFTYAKKMVDLYDAYPQHIYSVNLSFADAVAAYLSVSHRMNNYSDFEPMFNKLNALEKHTLKDKVAIALTIIQYRMLYMINMGDFTKCDEVITEFESLVEKHGKMIPVSTYFLDHYNIMLALFMQRQFDRSLDHCLKILNKPSEFRRELQHGASMMQFILHFELGNLLLLESLMRSVTRSMQQENKYDDFEKLFFSYIRKLIKLPRSQYSTCFGQMHAEFRHLYENANGKKMVLMQETLAWARSRHDGTSLQEILTGPLV